MSTLLYPLVYFTSNCQLILILDFNILFLFLLVRKKLHSFLYTCIPCEYILICNIGVMPQIVSTDKIHFSLFLEGQFIYLLPSEKTFLVAVGKQKISILSPSWFFPPHYYPRNRRCGPDLSELIVQWGKNQKTHSDRVQVERTTGTTPRRHQFTGWSGEFYQDQAHPAGGVGFECLEAGTISEEQGLAK